MTQYEAHKRDYPGPPSKRIKSIGRSTSRYLICYLLAEYIRDEDPDQSDPITVIEAYDRLEEHGDLLLDGIMYEVKRV